MKQKMTLKLFTMLLVLISCSSSKSQNDIYEGISIQNTKTDKYTRIKGTKVFLVIPDEYSVLKDIRGIQNANGSISISIMDFQIGNYFSYAKNVSKTAFESQGAKVTEYFNFKLNGYNAVLARMHRDSTGEAYTLIYGDSSFCVLIGATITTKDEKAIQESKKCLLTSLYDKNSHIDPFETANFEIVNSTSSYKFSEFQSDMYVFTENGIKPNQEDDNIIVLQLPFQKEYMLDPNGVLDLFAEKLKNQGIQNINKVTESTYKVKNAMAYKRINNGELNNRKVMINNAFIVNESSMIYVLQIAKKNFEQNKVEYDNIINAITLK